MTRTWRLLIFDVLSPLTSAAAFVTIGVALDWPLWWVLPNRLRATELADVVRLAPSVAEATDTFSPQDPSSAIVQAAKLVSPERAESFAKSFSART